MILHGQTTCKCVGGIQTIFFFTFIDKEVEWAELENQNEELQDFEMVELADCGDSSINSAAV
jgi:hypothetical protein